jgi:hypothetical protein
MIVVVYNGIATFVFSMDYAILINQLEHGYVLHDAFLQQIHVVRSNADSSNARKRLNIVLSEEDIE